MWRNVWGDVVGPRPAPMGVGKEHHPAQLWPQPQLCSTPCSNSSPAQAVLCPMLHLQPNSALFPLHPQASSASGPAPPPSPVLPQTLPSAQAPLLSQLCSNGRGVWTDSITGKLGRTRKSLGTTAIDGNSHLMHDGLSSHSSLSLLHPPPSTLTASG